MKDRVPLYPGRVKLTPVAGQANTYDMSRADSPQQEGTPLNKATLLSDETAALFGKSNPTPNDIFKLLSKAAIANSDGITDVLGNIIDIPADQIVDGVKIATGTYVGTGTSGINGKTSLTFQFAPKYLFIVYLGTNIPSNYGVLSFPNASIDCEGLKYLIENSYQHKAGFATKDSYTCYTDFANNGETINWYVSDGTDINQLNQSGAVYTYFAIG